MAALGREAEARRLSDERSSPTRRRRGGERGFDRLALTKRVDPGGGQHRGASEGEEVGRRVEDEETPEDAPGQRHVFEGGGSARLSEAVALAQQEETEGGDEAAGREKADLAGARPYPRTEQEADAGMGAWGQR